MKILFLAANPSQLSHLDLEEELRSLEQELLGVKFRDSITLVAKHAVRADDLIRHVRSERPNVIHFSGHGSTTGIVLRDDTGGHNAVTGVSLRQFLEGRGVDLVVLNACYSKDQADEILGAVRTVVGTTGAVADEAARRFTVAFYRSLGDGLSVREAFRDGSDGVALHGLFDTFHNGGELDFTLAPIAPVAPLSTPNPVEKWVDLNYPSDSGLQAKLAAAGYKVKWCPDNKLARSIDLEGWQVVVEPDRNGVLSKFRLKDRPSDQTLVKRLSPKF
jgi:hypothetical protein